jgi:hypothetical protein
LKKRFCLWMKFSGTACAFRTVSLKTATDPGIGRTAPRRGRNLQKIDFRGIFGLDRMSSFATSAINGPEDRALSRVANGPVDLDRARG